MSNFKTSKINVENNLSPVQLVKLKRFEVFINKSILFPRSIRRSFPNQRTHLVIANTR